MAYKKFLKGISALALVLCLIIAGCSDDSDDSSDNDNNNNGGNANGGNARSLLTITDMPQEYVINWGDVTNKSDIKWSELPGIDSVNQPPEDDYKPYIIGCFSYGIDGSFNTGSFNTCKIASYTFEYVNGKWSPKLHQEEFNYTGKASVYVSFQTGQDYFYWGWNDVDFVNGNATIAFPDLTTIGSGSGTFPEPIGKLTITNIPETYNDNYIFLAGGASDVTALYGMNDITFTSYTNYTYHLVQISDGTAEVPLYKINAGATSYSTLFSPYDGNGSITALSVIILSNSELNVANASSVMSNCVAVGSITSGTFSGGNLTVSLDTWISYP